MMPTVTATISFNPQRQVLVCRFCNLGKQAATLRTLSAETDFGVWNAEGPNEPVESKVYSAGLKSRLVHLPAGGTRTMEIEISEFDFPSPGRYCARLTYNARHKKFGDVAIPPDPMVIESDSVEFDVGYASD